MGKRKSKEFNDICKKVRKLERKLQKYKSRDSRSSSSSSDEYCRLDYSSGKNDNIDYGDDTDEEPFQDQPVEEMSSENIAGPSVIASTETAEEVLEPDILEMLGDDPTVQKEYGDELHKDIATRWSHILYNGLSKENKSDLFKQYLPARNCSNLRAPKLNLEIEAALSPINVKKDLFSQSKQNQLASALSAIGKVLTWAISSKDVPQVQDIIKPLSDAGRLLCDSHYRESQSRRYAITNNINKQTRDIVKNTKVSEFLFGDNLADHLKSSKAITRSGLELKSTIQRAPFRTLPGQSQRGALNARGMARTTAGELRQNPPQRRPAPASQGRRTEPNSRRNNTARPKTKRQWH